MPALEQKEIPAKTPAATLAATQAPETETQDSGTPATGPLRPTLPEPDYAGSALDTISKIMAWATPQVLEQIKKKGLEQWAQLSDVNPLAWNPDIAKASARTFKEMWDCGHAASSLSQNGLYEAGGSLFWIQPLPEPSQVSGQVSWSNVVKGLALLNPKKMHGGTSRILWPFCLETCAKDYQVSRDKFPVGLQLLHGHTVVFSWWLDMYQALVDTDEVKIGQLIECALCATVQVRLLNTAAEIAAASIEAAAQTWELASCLSEPFHLFALKLTPILDAIPKKDRASQVKTVTYLQANYKNQLRFQGKVLNKTMFSAAQAVCQAFPDGGLGQRLLNFMFLWHGPVLSSYARLYKMVTTVSGWTKDSGGHSNSLQEDVLASIMAFGLADLKSEDIYAHELTSDDMLFGEASVPGWLQMAFLRVCCLQFLQNVADKANASQQCRTMMDNMTPGALGLIMHSLNCMYLFVKSLMQEGLPDRSPALCLATCGQGGRPRTSYDERCL